VVQSKPKQNLVCENCKAPISDENNNHNLYTGHGVLLTKVDKFCS